MSRGTIFDGVPEHFQMDYGFGHEGHVEGSAKLTLANLGHNPGVKHPTVPSIAQWAYGNWASS